MTEQQKQEYKNYIGQFMGSQQKNSGVKKDGQPWTSHDILFHHGDMTKPIRFTWFAPTVDYVPNTIYRVVYVVDSFTVNNEARTAKKAIKVEVSSEPASGYQQSATQQPQPTGTTNAGVPTGDSHVDITSSLDAYGKLYKEKIDPSNWEKNHYIVTYLIKEKPALHPKFKEIADHFTKVVHPVEEVVVKEDVKEEVKEEEINEV